MKIEIDKRLVKFFNILFTIIGIVWLARIPALLVYGYQPTTFTVVVGFLLTGLFLICGLQFVPDEDKND